jgi:ankyrin repeat protein
VQDSIYENNILLRVARANKDFNYIPFLLNNFPKINVNFQDCKTGHSALLIYSRYGENSHSEVKALLKHPKIDVNLTDADGNTALFHAVCANSIEIVNSLLAVPEIKINVQNVIGATCLMLACCESCECDIEIVHKLLKMNEINIFSQDGFGRTVIDYAKDEKIIQLLDEFTKIKENQYESFLQDCVII